MDYASRRNLIHKKQFFDFCVKNAISIEIANQANDLLIHIMSKRLFRGPTKMAVMSICIYKVCVANNIPINLYKIGEQFGTSKSSILQAGKEIKKIENESII